jgi:hypothetical protein
LVVVFEAVLVFVVLMTVATAETTAEGATTGASSLVLGTSWVFSDPFEELVWGCGTEAGSI